MLFTEYAGWMWKGDTSSDEVTGHMFGLPIAARHLYPPGPQKDALVSLITTIMSYIVNNGYTLVDVTGLPTTWGHWDPPTLNGNRLFSDGRGLNSLQILAFMQAVVIQSSDQAAQALMARAYADLTSTNNEYNLNMLNLKIESPIDDNFSDDELTFLPYYTFLTNCGDETRFFDYRKCLATRVLIFLSRRAAVIQSLSRTWGFVRYLKSDLWNAIYGALSM